MLLVFVIVSAAWLVIVGRYARSPQRRKLATRFLRNRTALIVGASGAALLVVISLAVGGGFTSAPVAFLLGLAIAAGYDRQRPVPR